MKPSESNIEDVKSFFVDRQADVEAIRNTLLGDDASLPVYFITGDIDMGKTWLLHHLYLECQEEGWLTIFIDFRYGRGFTNYVSILEDIQMTLGQKFSRYLQRTAEMLQIKLDLGTDEGDAGVGINIGEGAELSNVDFSGQFAGRDIVNIREFYVQLKDHRLLQQLHVIQPLTQAFIEDLIQFIGDKPVIFLFDDIGNVDHETLDVETRRWLIGDFVRPLCRHTELKNVRFIITQNGESEEELVRLLGRLAKRQVLKPFEEDAVFDIYKTYLVEKHQFDPDQVTDFALSVFHRQVKGVPGAMYDALI